MTQLIETPLPNADTPTLAEVLELSTAAQNLLFRDAHTANSFADEPVGEEQIKAVYDLVKWGPTAMNTQPMRVVLVRSREAREDLVGLMNEGNRAKTLAAPLVAILAADDDFHEELPRTFPVAPGARDAFNGHAQRRVAAASLNTALQIGYFLVASAPPGWPPA